MVKVLLAGLLLNVLLNACNKDGDAAIRKRLPGTWTFEQTTPHGSDLKCKITYFPDGHYACQITVVRTSNVPRISKLEGVFEIQSGVLIDTQTNRSESFGPRLPETSRARIIQADNSFLIIEPEPRAGVTLWTNRVVFRKVGK